MEKITSKVIGKTAEEEVAVYLQSQGLQLVQRNFQCRCGEIDLIMREKDRLVFVEVRYRKNQLFGHGAETVTKTKQQRIIKTALYYLQQKKLMDKVPCRFDVAIIHATDNKITWIKHAFDAA